MAGFNIISVVSQKPSQAADLFRNVGLKGLEPAFKSILEEEVNRITHIGLDAAKAAVPVRTKELRDAIRIGDFGSLSKEVYIEASVHESSRTRFKVNNPTLAEILDEGFSRQISHPDVIRPLRNGVKRRNFQRNFDSIPAGRFSAISAGTPTARWITLARQNIFKAVAE